MLATYEGNNWRKQTLASARAILDQSRWDCKRADILLGTLQGATKASIGSCFELAWAYDAGKPVICVMDHEHHSHPMIEQSVTHPVDTLEQAIEIAKALA
jgi:nucleoside 2-deoxyribosyltransferase